MKYKNILAITLGFILFTVLPASISLVLDYQQLVSEFKADVVTINRRFAQQIASIETVLISVTGLHHASENLNQAELSSFSEEMLKAYPFIVGIISMEKVEDGDIVDFENRMKKQGYVSYKIKKYLNLNSKSSTYYLPVNFVEPMTPMSASLLGLDVRTMPGMPEVIKISVNTGEVSASEIQSLPKANVPFILMLKAIYLGRYPPETKGDRLIMLNGLVAIKINIDHFMKYLDLPEFGLFGKLENLQSIEATNSSESYEISYDSLLFVESISMYKNNYRFTINRDVSIDMINKRQLVILWFLSMIVFLSVIMFYKKRKSTEEKMRHLAFFDSLTNLPNRESFKARLSSALSEADKNATIGAVLFMDIDEFKRINDTLGHGVGDELLKQLSQRLISLMRQSDAVSHGVTKVASDKQNSKRKEIKSSDVVTRLGGDEFIVLLNDVKDARSAGVVANRILQKISQSFSLDGHEVFVTSSIGIALFPQDGTDVEMLLKHADTAMYHAKDMGKNNYQFYLENMSSKIEHRLKLEGKLHQAIEKNELVLMYQPQIDSHTNKIVAAEALIRWQQSELGMIFPDDFIPLAEETGQIFKIGQWVIDEACRQNKAWQVLGYDPIRVAINLSSTQFMQEDLLKIIVNALETSGLDAKFLELEITESIMMRNIEQTIYLIKKFTDMNIGVSVDDFGTGYSSLSYLKKFPLDSLKIDKSFVMDIPDDKDDMMITSAIISMAKSLNLQVIAEGVENQQQVDFLKEHNCDLLQGYHFSKPIPANEFEKLLAQQVSGSK